MYRAKPEGDGESQKNVECNKTNQTATLDLKFSPLYRQLLAATSPIIATLGAGFIVGYSAIFLPQLQSKDSTIQITNDDASWIASLSAFGMAPGCIIGGLIIQKYGRKFLQYLFCIPSAVGWLAIIFASSVPHFLVGRFLTGLASGMLGPCSVYIGETSEPKYRGFLLASVTLSISLGIMFCHILGTFLHWKVVALVAASFPFVILFILQFTPESPAWLLTQNRLEEAEEAFFWLRGRSQDASNEFENLLRKQEALKKEEDASDIKSGSFAKLKINIRKPEFLKPLGVILLCFFILQFSGINSVIFYTVRLMEDVTGPGYEYYSMIIIDVVRVFMSILACILLKICYRRTLTLLSGIGTSVCLISVSIFMYFDKTNTSNFNYSLFSMAFLIGYICFITVGMFPVPWVLQGEILQQATRGFSSGFASAINFVFFFIVVKTFVELSEVLEIYGLFMFYGVISLIGTILLYFVMPETKNKTLQQIEESFSKNKSET